MRVRKTAFWTAAGVLALAALTLAPSVTADQQILDDLIVVGSACVGQDCVNGESFGFDTLRLKENNLRIKAQDTSTSASFPRNDWQITFNDSSNGGANKFSIDDIDGGRTPFTIEAGAPSHSLYVDDGGRLGLGTSTPVVDVHVKSGNTPTLRLEQDGSSGFTPQTWDLAGNEANFFLRDASNGSTLPFRVFPGAPSNALTIEASGDVGVGLTAPETAFHVERSNGTAKLFVEENQSSNPIVQELGEFRAGSTRTARLLLAGNAGANANTWRLSVAGGATTGNFQLTRADSTAVPFNLTSVGDLTINGSLTELAASSRELKKGFTEIDSQEMLGRVLELPLSEWSYKKDANSIRHFGPMAEDFMALFGLGVNDKTIAPRDAASVALAAIQGLNQVVEAKDAQIDDLTARVAALEALLTVE